MRYMSRSITLSMITSLALLGFLLSLMTFIMTSYGDPLSLTEKTMILFVGTLPTFIFSINRLIKQSNDFNQLCVTTMAMLVEDKND